MKSATRPAFSRAMVEVVTGSQHADIVPEFLAQLGESSLRRESSGFSRFRAMPHLSHINRPSSRWKESTVRLPLIREKSLDLGVDFSLGRLECGMIGEPGGLDGVE